MKILIGGSRSQSAASRTTLRMIQRVIGTSIRLLPHAQESIRSEDTFHRMVPAQQRSAPPSCTFADRQSAGTAAAVRAFPWQHAGPLPSSRGSPLAPHVWRVADDLAVSRRFAADSAMSASRTMSSARCWPESTYVTPTVAATTSRCRRNRRASAIPLEGGRQRSKPLQERPRPESTPQIGLAQRASTPRMPMLIFEAARGLDHQFIAGRMPALLTSLNRRCPR